MLSRARLELCPNHGQKHGRIRRRDGTRSAEFCSEEGALEVLITEMGRCDVSEEDEKLLSIDIALAQFPQSVDDVSDEVLFTTGMINVEYGTSILNGAVADAGIERLSLN